MSERNPTREQDFVPEGLIPPGEATEKRDKSELIAVLEEISMMVKIDLQFACRDEFDSEYYCVYCDHPQRDGKHGDDCPLPLWITKAEKALAKAQSGEATEKRDKQTKFDQAMELLNEIFYSVDFLTDSIGDYFGRLDIKIVQEMQDKICKLREESL